MQIGFQHLNGLHTTERERRPFIQSAHLTANFEKEILISNMVTLDHWKNG